MSDVKKLAVSLFEDKRFEKLLHTIELTEDSDGRVTLSKELLNDAYHLGAQLSNENQTNFDRIAHIFRQIDDLENSILPIFRVLSGIIVKLASLGARILPTKAKIADSILLFVCKPDDAEASAGDLFEELEKVKTRHGSWYCNIWFTWELALLVIAKGRTRFTKSVFGPVLDLLKRKSS